jgi:hypothetical protein
MIINQRHGVNFGAGADLSPLIIQFCEFRGSQFDDSPIRSTVFDPPGHAIAEIELRSLLMLAASHLVTLNSVGRDPLL